MKTVTQPAPFTGAFIQLPVGKYARFPSAVAAKGGVVDKHLYDTLIESEADLKKKSAEELRAIMLRLGRPVASKARPKPSQVWDLLVKKAEDRCSSRELGKRAQARQNPEGYRLLRLLSPDEVTALKLQRQAKAILTLLIEHCRQADLNTFSEEQAEKLVKHGAVEGVLKTRQDPMRIFRYYRQALVSLKLLKVGA